MGILEQVTKMKEQGIPDNQIANKLQEQRVSPKEINDALNQSKIKNAVSDTEGMQPSIMNAPKTNKWGERYLYSSNPRIWTRNLCSSARIPTRRIRTSRKLRRILFSRN